MKKICKYFLLKEVIVLSLGSLFKRILIALKYEQKYLPVRDEIKIFLKQGFDIVRIRNTVLLSNYNFNQTQKFLLRLGTSDRFVMDQVIIGKEYFPIVRIITENGDKDSIRFIVDAGSNIGLTSIYFISIFTKAKILSIEPEKENFNHQLLNIEKNRLRNEIKVLMKALWKNQTDKLSMCCNFRDGGMWSRSVKQSAESNNEIIELITLTSIVNEYAPNQIIDILKIDIEGSEKELFESSEFIQELKKSVRYLCLEIHDELNIRDNINNLLVINGFDIFDSGETTFCFNKKFSKAK